MKYENEKIQKSLNSKNWLITWWICQKKFIIIEIIDKKCKSACIIYWWSQWSLYLVHMLQNILCYIISFAGTPYNGISNIIIIYHHIIVLYIYLWLAQTILIAVFEGSIMAYDCNLGQFFCSRPCWSSVLITFSLVRD